MKISLRSLLFLSFAGLMALTSAVILLVLHTGLEVDFQAYLLDSQNRVHVQVMEELETTVGSDGLWNSDFVARVGQKALDQGLLLRLSGRDGTEYWNAQKADPQASALILKQLNENLRARFPFSEPTLQEQTHVIKNGEKVLGVMGVWVFGPWSMNQKDLWFLQKIDDLTLWGAFFSLFPALGLGLFLTRILWRPLFRLENLAAVVASGRFDVPLPIGSSIKEVYRLQNSLQSMAKSLEDLERLRSERISDTAHELRTPLANLFSQLEALEDGLMNPDTKRFKAMKEEVSGLTLMIENWEVLDKARTSKEPISTDNFEIKELVQDILVSFIPRLEKKNQTCEIMGNSDVVLGNRDQIKQILVNLVENAHRYTPELGQIHIGWTVTNEKLTLWVTDNGPGIPEKDLPFIFDRFYRVEKSRNRNTGGSGLGLSIARALALGMNGDLTLRNKEPSGIEATFEVPI